MLNNTSSSTTGKTSNNIAYEFSPKKPLDLYLIAASSDIYFVYTDATNVISFTLISHNK